jgi:transaldolase
VAEHSRFAIRLRDTHALDLGAVRGGCVSGKSVVGDDEVDVVESSDSGEGAVAEFGAVSDDDGGGRCVDHGAFEWHFEGVVRTLTSQDVRAACDVLRPVFDATAERDGFVSIEVDPGFAHDAERTVADARLLWWLVDRPNVLVKVPATVAGLTAVTACLAEGISVNVTLTFSQDRYDAVMAAFLDGLEAARAAGRDLSSIASVASFFVSRVDTAIDQRLDAIGSTQAHALRGHAAIANARLAYERYEQVFSGERWRRLAAAGARPQRPLSASTGVKDPAYSDTRYVDELLAPGTVNTMPEATLLAVADHGAVRGDRVTGSYPEARRVLKELGELGVDYADVVEKLEREGVAKFQNSWRALLTDVESAMADA